MNTLLKTLKRFWVLLHSIYRMKVKAMVSPRYLISFWGLLRDNEKGGGFLHSGGGGAPCVEWQGHQMDSEGGAVEQRQRQQGQVRGATAGGRLCGRDGQVQLLHILRRRHLKYGQNCNNTRNPGLTLLLASWLSWQDLAKFLLHLGNHGSHGKILDKILLR